MSNWSVVMIGWSGIDRKVPDHEERLRQVVTRYAEIVLKPRPDQERCGWQAHYPCPDRRSIGSACEFLAVTHENHFSPSEMIRALGEFEWDYPEEVVVLSKHEQQCRYEQAQLSPTETNYA